MSIVSLYQAGLVLAALALPSAQRTAPETRDSPEVEEAVRHYVEGWYEGDFDRVQDGLHPNLLKLRVLAKPGEKNKLEEMGRQAVVEVVRLQGSQRLDEGEELRVDVLGVSSSIALAKVHTPQFVDYAHLAKINDEWQVINVLWALHRKRPLDITEETREAVRKVALDYVEGIYTNDVERVSRSLHPRLRRLQVVKLPNQREFLGLSTPDDVLEYLHVGQLPVPPDSRQIELVLHDVFRNIATVSIDSARFVDYLHLAKIDGEWKILQMTWRGQQKIKRAKR